MTSKENYIVGPDGYHYRVVQPYAQNKYDYLKINMDTFTTAMRKKYKNITYIDLYSSTGKCIVQNTQQEIIGSALIAHNYNFTRYLYNDLNSEWIDDLHARIDNNYPEHRDMCQYFTLDAESFIENIVNNNIVTNQYELILIFSDPNDLSPSFKTIKLISENLRADIAMHFSYGIDLKRNLTSTYLKQNDSKLDAFLGDKEWRNIPNITSKKILEYYRDRLSEIGYLHQYACKPVKNTRNALLYYLFTISKNKLGIKFGEIANKFSTRQQALFD